MLPPLEAALMFRPLAQNVQVAQSETKAAS